MEKVTRGQQKGNLHILRNILWGLAIILACVLGGLTWLQWYAQRATPVQFGRPLDGLQSFGAVPDFSLIERSGKEIHRENLQGKIWVANFIYTTCKDTCPLQSAEIARLQEEFKDYRDLSLLSISVDPDRDDPKTLSAYAQRFKADPERWLFLTGRKEEIYRLAQEGFRLSASPLLQPDGQSAIDFIHSSRFVLIDRKGQIRGYYESTDADALRRLRSDLTALLNNHP
jgi:protein SCO1/2